MILPGIAAVITAVLSIPNLSNAIPIESHRLDHGLANNRPDNAATLESEAEKVFSQFWDLRPTNTVETGIESSERLAQAGNKPAGWIISREGIRLWNPSPQPNETCSWTGAKDSNGYATGRGIVVWYSRGKIAQVNSANYVRGRSSSPYLLMDPSGSAYAVSAAQGRTRIDVSSIAQTRTSGYRPSPPDRSKPQVDMNKTLEAIKTGVQIYNEAKKATPDKFSADLIVRSVSVRNRKSNGKAWGSGNGDPDLKVEVRRGFSSITTGVIKNSTYASFSKKKLRVSAGDKITIRVYDQDVLADDLVGSYTKTLTKETLRQGRATWDFGQVISLKIEFEL